MSGFLIDTNIPSEMTRRDPDPRVQAWVAAADRSKSHISVITVGEIRKGFTILRDDPRRQRFEQWLARDLEVWFKSRILPVSKVIAERWGVLAGERQLQGRPLNSADGLIAATALEHDLTVVTRNVRDFADLGVSIINPWEAQALR